MPLDYSNQSSDETLQLDLVRVSAVRQPKKGSILFNPGASGRSYIAGPSAYALLAITGGEYDLIGFEPRYVVLF